MIVPGDVNSTLAAALACAHLRVPLAHVESGLRSFDRSMPEEVNRVLTDQVSDLLFTHSPEAERNLAAEGIGGERVRLVGNTMIDSLVALEGRFRGRRACEALGAEPGSLPARHAAPPGARRRRRCSNPRSSGSARSRPTMPVLFPVHPRTRAALGDGGIAVPAGLTLLEPVGYLDFLSLEADARARAHRLRRDPGGDDLPRRAAASPSATTPSGRSRSRRAPTRCSASIRRGSPRSPSCSTAPRTAPASRRRCGTGTPPTRLAADVAGYLGA